MNSAALEGLVAASPAEIAKRRLLAFEAGPLVVLEWYRVLFFHFEIDPDVMRELLPASFELELYERKAIVSLVALTKRHIRPTRTAPLWSRLLPLVVEQRFFNVRTYVRHGDEPGAFFFWSWLSRPWGLPLPDQPFGLSCGFADSRYGHRHETGELEGSVTRRRDRRALAYKALIKTGTSFDVCAPGSLAEFALERYTGYFFHRAAGRVFRAWHAPWPQSAVEIETLDDRLVADKFPWFERARFVEANYSPGFPEVWIGRPQVLSNPPRGIGPWQDGVRASGQLGGTTSCKASVALF